MCSGLLLKKEGLIVSVAHAFEASEEHSTISVFFPIT